jgi:uncharacterized membrane protein
MVQFCYAITLISSCFAALVLGVGFAVAKGAPQEAAVAALAIALAVIPYVFSRCIQIASDRSETRRLLERIAEGVSRRDREQLSAHLLPAERRAAEAISTRDS